MHLPLFIALPSTHTTFSPSKFKLNSFRRCKGINRNKQTNNETDRLSNKHIIDPERGMIK